jgi:hypothetical protein
VLLAIEEIIQANRPDLYEPAEEDGENEEDVPFLEVGRTVAMTTKKNTAAPRATEMYAGNGPNGKLFHFYPSAYLVTFCGCKEAFHIRVCEAPAVTPDTYWAWWDNKEAKFTHTYPARIHIEICFPAGIKEREERGFGVAVPVTIEYL